MTLDPRAAGRRLAILPAVLAVLVATAFDDAANGPAAAARSLLAAGDTAAAVHGLQRSYRKSNDPAAYLLLGRLYRAHGSIESRHRSQSVLEEARARFGDDMDVRMELGRTYFAQKFYPDAVKCFRDVLQRQPDHCDAHYMVGLYHFQNWKRMNEYTDDLRHARDELAEVVRCDPGNADAAFKYLIVRYAQEDTSSAECSRVLARFSDDPRFWLYRGTLEYDAGRFAACASDFAHGLERLDAPTREVYGDLERILSYRERARVAGLPGDRHDAITRAYWIDADPDPTTPLNECELEHVYRMFVADMLYSSAPADRRGWETDRGVTFVKFGRPRAIDQTLEGRDYRDGKTEFWLYTKQGMHLRIVFIDEYLNGNLRIPYRLDYMWSFVNHSMPRSDYHSPARTVPGRLAVAVFRDDNMTSSAYLALQVASDSLRAALDPAGANRFVVRGAYFDTDWKRAGGFCDSLGTLDLEETALAGARSRIEVRRVVVPFARYHFACAFENESASARALARADGDASRFITSGVAVSDVLLVVPDGPSRCAIEREDRRVWPRVENRYAPGEPLRAYMEIYDLSMKGGTSQYDVRFAIYPYLEEDTPTWLDWGSRAMELVGLSGVDPTISQTFRRQGRAPDDHELITVDIDSLDPGRYVLAIQVTDRLSGAVATSEADFAKETTPAADGGAAH